MRPAAGVSRAGMVRLTAVLVASAVAAGCWIHVASAAAGVIDTISVGRDPYGVSADGTRVWVTNDADGTVSEIQASTGTVIDTIAVGGKPLGVSADGTHVWVANNADGTVSEIEASSGSVIDTIPAGREPVGVSSDGDDVWVANPGPETVTEIEASSGTVIDTIPVESRPYFVSADGTDVWVTSPEQNIVTEIEASDGDVIRRVPVGAEPRGVFSDGTDVWVAMPAEDAVDEIEASSGAVIRTIPVAGGPEAVSGDSAYVWVTDFAANTVTEIARSTGTVVHTIDVGREPEGVSTAGGDTWVANYGGLGTVSELVPTPPGPVCNTNTADIRLSPGLTNTPTVQKMKITGRMSGCEAEPFATVNYTATLKTAGPVTCAALAGPGEPATGAARFDWSSTAKTSKGSLTVPLAESLDLAFEFAGEAATGPYSPMPFTGTTTTRYVDGATCGQEIGKKLAKPVKEGELRQSEVSFF